jgi:hypothetical protein
MACIIKAIGRNLDDMVYITQDPAGWVTRNRADAQVIEDEGAARQQAERYSLRALHSGEGYVFTVEYLSEITIKNWHTDIDKLATALAHFDQESHGWPKVELERVSDPEHYRQQARMIFAAFAKS